MIKTSVTSEHTLCHLLATKHLKLARLNSYSGPLHRSEDQKNSFYRLSSNSGHNTGYNFMHVGRICLFQLSRMNVLIKEGKGVLKGGTRGCWGLLIAGANSSRCSGAWRALVHIFLHCFEIRLCRLCSADISLLR